MCCPGVLNGTCTIERRSGTLWEGDERSAPGEKSGCCSAPLPGSSTNLHVIGGGDIFVRAQYTCKYSTKVHKNT